ncbi:MAG TPA: cupredoxin family copper-binding protein [Pinirhizobacter sp.]|uniref:cupredoxin domain-containing protein n=1 Tax=Pinirhizobacter sp. TaxID=2950432 RepID=UPI002CD55C91|nr:cupredoxin family copper-binding protein [Pinirhizobacter sp.]HMH68711.1 cupredoxin family copper-binding protein [Pinirhizobacter sp.]
MRMGIMASALALAWMATVSNAMAAKVTPSAPPPGPRVQIQNFAFMPKTLTVSAGSKVVWTNLDEEPHIVTSAGGNFRSSPGLDTNDSYSFTFDKPGTYTYYCSIHPMMVGTIVVQ